MKISVKTLIFLFLVIFLVFYSWQIKRNDLLIEKKCSLIADRYKILKSNIKLSINLNIESESLPSSILMTGEKSIDDSLRKINKSLILWIRDDHCISCIKSIYKQISGCNNKKNFNLILLTNFKSKRELNFFISQFPKSFKIINVTKGYSEMAFNISMPVMFFKNNKILKHFIIADKNFPFILKQYLENINDKYFIQ